MQLEELLDPVRKIRLLLLPSHDHLLDQVEANITGLFERLQAAPPPPHFDFDSPDLTVEVIERRPGVWGFRAVGTHYEWGSYASEHRAYSVAAMNFQTTQNAS